ncbi:hypothetical protein K504DRAFT_503057 [Pleomassaria siparia CBS 279.74]|uniref:Uncharacterized protein n=1 Tax=Pleomassaria siparia CBS 279.74 TaxID=1314801 RepID=A0A6G1K844_9PLEO|nr:hypothetical protein K504DRAFT_503057 [Pleomassaria siparia CBS 279.74]
MVNDAVRPCGPRETIKKNFDDDRPRQRGGSSEEQHSREALHCSEAIEERVHRSPPSSSSFISTLFGVKNLGPLDARTGLIGQKRKEEAMRYIDFAARAEEAHGSDLKDIQRHGDEEECPLSSYRRRLGPWPNPSYHAPPYSSDIGLLSPQQTTISCWGKARTSWKSPTLKRTMGYSDRGEGRIAKLVKLEASFRLQLEDTGNHPADRG